MRSRERSEHNVKSQQVNPPNPTHPNLYALRHQNRPRKTCRLWHLARLEQKEVFDETWISDATCVGHNEEDVQPFHDLFLEEQDSEREGQVSSEVPTMKKYYTNGELYKLLHPAEADLPYVYDNFDWPHCEVSLCVSGVRACVCARVCACVRACVHVFVYGYPRWIF